MSAMERAISPVALMDDCSESATGNIAEGAAFVSETANVSVTPCTHRFTPYRNGFVAPTPPFDWKRLFPPFPQPKPHKQKPYDWQDEEE